MEEQELNRYRSPVMDVLYNKTDQGYTRVTVMEELQKETNDLLWAIMIGLFLLIGVALFALTLVR